MRRPDGEGGIRTTSTNPKNWGTSDGHGRGITPPDSMIRNSPMLRREAWGRVSDPGEPKKAPTPVEGGWKDRARVTVKAIQDHRNRPGAIAVHRRIDPSTTASPMNKAEEYLALAREARAAAAQAYLAQAQARLMQQHAYWLRCAAKAETRTSQTH